MTEWNRRDVLKTGSTAAFALGAACTAPFARLPAILRPALHAGVLDNSSKKFLFVFQRGGNDGVNTVIPRGDTSYNLTTRPTLLIPEADVTAAGTDLGNGFAQLHPRLEPIMEIYNASHLNGQDGPGQLAVLHRIGYSGQSQSHFDSQQFWENGLPGNPDLEEGMIYRHIEQIIDTSAQRFSAAAMTTSQMVALKGATPHPTIPDVNTMRFRGTSARVDKFLGSLPTDERGRGLLGVFGGPKDFAAQPYRGRVYDTGLALVDAVTTVQEALAQGTYVAENGASYPNSTFGRRLRDAAMLLKRTPVRILGVEIGGWDTHTNQGGSYGSHANLLEQIGQGFQALHRDLASQWDQLCVATMTEFGRTSVENGSFGTDHAFATTMFIAGGGVRGGVYNCDSTTWSSGDLFSQNERYVRHTTDFRAVFAEIFSWMGNTNLSATIPGYEALEGRADFQPLGFFA